MATGTTGTGVRVRSAEQYVCLVVAVAELCAESAQHFQVDALEHESEVSDGENNSVAVWLAEDDGTGVLPLR